MLTLPIPMFAAIVLGFLFARLVFMEQRHGPLAGLLAICAIQSMMIALAQHYGVGWAQLLQPITATFVAPAAWLAFVITALRQGRVTDIVHLAGPVLAVIARFAFPFALDVLIPALFILYGSGILMTVRKGADALPRLRLDAAGLPARIWAVIGAALVASAFSDVLIVGAILLGAGWLQFWLISMFSAANLLLVGLLSLSGAVQSTPSPQTQRAIAPETTEEDAEVMSRLATLMRDERPYLDPDLTLIRLARKLGTPAKTLSSTINRSTGENVSRYINNARIVEAQSRLKSGDRVTEAMLSAGFNTKSNFHREFLRVTGQSPSDWLNAQG